MFNNPFITQKFTVNCRIMDSIDSLPLECELSYKEFRDIGTKKLTVFLTPEFIARLGAKYITETSVTIISDVVINSTTLCNAALLNVNEDAVDALKKQFNGMYNCNVKIKVKTSIARITEVIANMKSSSSASKLANKLIHSRDIPCYLKNSIGNAYILNKPSSTESRRFQDMPDSITIC